MVDISSLFCSRVADPTAASISHISNRDQPTHLKLCFVNGAQNLRSLLGKVF
jgi:hypothetical protein